MASLGQGRLRRVLAPQIAAVEGYLEALEPQGSEERPIVFFNASTRIHTLSLNAAFSMLASWALRADRVPVRHLVCNVGLQPCVLGTDRRRPETHPPCRPCLALSQTLFPEKLSVRLRLDRGTYLEVLQELAGKPLADLAQWEFRGRPLGELCLPSVRWILRRHHLTDSPPTTGVYRGYLASAASLTLELESALSRLSPRALALFNGVFYPEAVARLIARERAIPVVTHEVGLAAISAFFTRGEATFRQATLSASRRLSEEEDRRLDRYLEDRFRGSFSMAGIRFWERMDSIPEWLVDLRRRFRQMVGVFPNVVFDTSQVHANHIFTDMMAWLDDVAETIAGHPETLFVFRAHPDENRPGKESQESVAAWFRGTALTRLPNAILIEPRQPISSYELIRQSKLVLVYSSSVGLEASVLGAPVLCAGRARYTQVPSVYRPKTRAEYSSQLESLLRAEQIELPQEFERTARAFLYAELFEESLDLSEFLEPMAGAPGMVEFRRFSPGRLAASQSLQVIRRGFIEGARFSMNESPPYVPSVERGDEGD
jgi:hypothetical protein